MAKQNLKKRIKQEMDPACKAALIARLNSKKAGVLTNPPQAKDVTISIDDNGIVEHEHSPTCGHHT